MVCRMKSSKRRELMEELMERERSSCFYCDRKVHHYGAHWPYHADQVTLDHIIPHSQGGTNEFGNFVIACRECNEERDLMPADEFLILKRSQPIAA